MGLTDSRYFVKNGKTLTVQGSFSRVSFLCCLPQWLWHSLPALVTLSKTGVLLLSKTGVSVSSFFRCFQNKLSHLVGNSIRGKITKVEVTKLKGSFWTPRSWCLVPSSLPGWDVSWARIFLSFSSRRFRITCLLFWPVTLSPVRLQVPRSQV